MKNKTLAERIKEKKRTPYQQIAEKYDTSEVYVGQIATGRRSPIRGKGLKIVSDKSFAQKDDSYKMATSKC